MMRQRQQLAVYKEMEVEELLANSVVGGTLSWVDVQLHCTSTLSTPRVTHENVEAYTSRWRRKTSHSCQTYNCTTEVSFLQSLSGRLKQKVSLLYSHCKCIMQTSDSSRSTATCSFGNAPSPSVHSTPLYCKRARDENVGSSPSPCTFVEGWTLPLNMS